MPPAEVRAALARLGLSQSEWARLIGVNPRTVRNWCADPQRTPVPRWARFVLRLMDRHPDDWNVPRTLGASPLLGETEPTHPPAGA